MWTGLAALPGIIMNNVEFGRRVEEETKKNGGDKVAATQAVMAQNAAGWKEMSDRIDQRFGTPASWWNDLLERVTPAAEKQPQTGQPIAPREAEDASMRKYLQALSRGDLDEVTRVEAEATASEAPSALKRFLLGKAAEPDFDAKEHFRIERGQLRSPAELQATEQAQTAIPDLDATGAVDKARQAGSEIEAAMSVTARPDIDTSALQGAVSLARQLVGLLNQAGTASARAEANVGREMRRNFSDGLGSMP